MARGITINSDDKLEDSKQIYLNNGDLIIIREGKKDIYYLVSSYVDPEESHTATFCVFMQLQTGNKLNRFPQKRTTNLTEIVSVINHSFFHKKNPIRKNHVTIIGRDFYDIHIKEVQEVI